MRREHFLRERSKRLILTNHLRDIRLHKQRKSLSRNIPRSWSRSDPDTVTGHTEPARGRNYQRLPELERNTVWRNRYLRELSSAPSDV